MLKRMLENFEVFMKVSKNVKRNYLSKFFIFIMMYKDNLLGEIILKAFIINFSKF